MLFRQRADVEKDVALQQSLLERMVALDAYLQHPLHQALVKDLKPSMEWAAVDYTV